MVFEKGHKINVGRKKVYKEGELEKMIKNRKEYEKRYRKENLKRERLRTKNWRENNKNKYRLEQIRHNKRSKEKRALKSLFKGKIKRTSWNSGLKKEMDSRIKTPWLGKNRDKDTIERMRLANIGRMPWNKGKTIYDDHRISNWSKGKHLSEDHKKKLIEHRKKIILPIKDTSIEIKIQNFLEKLQMEYFKHKYMNIEHGYQCDIFIPSLNLVIECDGDYWHKYPIGRDIDKIRTKELINNGFKVLRLWERDIKLMDIDKFREKIQCR